MNRTELSWFRLTFPRDLSTDAVMAVLSGLSGTDRSTCLVFELSANARGIEHRIGVSANAVDALLGELRSAISSLRADTTEPTQTAATRRLLWQLTPATATIRTEPLEAISASLLASLYPLTKGEEISLAWRMQSALRPSLEVTPEGGNTGRVRALRDKLALPGLYGYGELWVVAGSHGQTTHLLRRTSAVLRSLSTPHGRLVGEPPLWGQITRFIGQRGRYYSVRELAAVIGWPVGAPDVPGLVMGASKRLLPSAELPRFGRIIGTTDFPGITRRVAVPVQASTRHTYILGPTGTGKTTLIQNLIATDLAENRGLAVIDTNGDLARSILDFIPEHRIGDVVYLDPADSQAVVGLNPLAASPDPYLAADQLVELFRRLWKEFWGPRSGQLFHLGLSTLTQQPQATLLDLARLFTDATYRHGAVGRLDDPLGLESTWAWYESLSEGERLNMLGPVLNKASQFTNRPIIRNVIGQATPLVTLRQIMAERKVLIVNLSKGILGQEASQLLASLVVVGLWQAATERARLPIDKRPVFMAYLDEVQDLLALPGGVFDEMLAQGRKFGFALNLAHQNLGQLTSAMREAILANAHSKIVFRVEPSDARTLAHNFSPYLNAADLANLPARSVAAVVGLDDGGAARPVTLTTPPPPTPTGHTELVRQSSRDSYARPLTEIEAELRRRITPEPSSGPLGQKPRQP